MLTKKVAIILQSEICNFFMGDRESQILEVIWEWGGEASIDRIARETSMSTDYVRLVCGYLSRSNFIDFQGSKLCKLKRRGKIEVAKSSSLQQKKIVISQHAVGANHNKRRHLLLGY